MSTRVGLGFDVHAFGNDGRLVLAGVTLEGPGLVGHSDADVVAHVVADAVLGGAGLPDIGTRFPAADERFRDASSIELLEDVASDLARRGFSVANVDVVVAAERPVLAPHLDRMVANLARALGPALADPRTAAVRVTPKRGEGLGAIGRAEGIAAWAVALVEGRREEGRR